MSFQFTFTPTKLQACVPSNPRITDWYDVICKTLPEYNITTWQRVAQWIAQVGHESGNFRTLVENLNYGAVGLKNTWPRSFPTLQIAQSYERQPERIANRTYANRMGNGSEQSGDGWKFRGRGLIQITGKSNYIQASKTLYGDENILLNDPDILKEPDGAIRSACWFWNSRNLSVPADKEDTQTVTRLINGGLNGLDDRVARYNTARSVLRG